jgi:hypothetical protein
VVGWNAPRAKGQTEQPRWRGKLDHIDEALRHRQVVDVLSVWWTARLHEAPAYSGGVVDAWPVMMAEGLAICRAEEEAIDRFQRWQEREAEAK